MKEMANLVPRTHEILRNPVRKWLFESNIKSLVGRMLKTMTKHKGVGIAANQIGVNAAVCLVKTGDGILTLVNPVLRKKWDAYLTVEGCLSLPNEPYVVKRYRGIDISYQNEEGEFEELSLQNDPIVQRILHEIDHLNGVMISDYCPHINCTCMFVNNRKALTIEDVMSLPDLRKELGTGYQIKSNRHIKD